MATQEVHERAAAHAVGDEEADSTTVIESVVFSSPDNRPRSPSPTRKRTLQRRGRTMQDVLATALHSLLLLGLGGGVVACSVVALLDNTDWYRYQLNPYSAMTSENYEREKVLETEKPLADLYHLCRGLCVGGVFAHAVVILLVLTYTWLPSWRRLLGWFAIPGEAAACALLMLSAYLFMGFHPARMEKSGLCSSKNTGPCKTFYGQILSEDDSSNNAIWHPTTGWMMLMLMWPMAMATLIESVWSRVAPTS
eukprot:TRINITY_DN2213_c0_g1_i1.p1 TRINITY_DN2213_c0_g1~~TRINITY_DN2213_c0_g1_i1.p1  ORF type:complete len:252 (-),score=49.78 TRINITY_DN2213_c0_g1_i1:69-824(-)